MSETEAVVITLIAHDLAEPPAYFSEEQAQGSWVAVTAPWHPAVLRCLGQLPVVDSAAGVIAPRRSQVYLVADGARDWIPSGASTQAADAGAHWIEAGLDRLALVGALLDRLAPGSATPQGDDSLTADFMALGLMRWWLRDLSHAMGHAESFDQQVFRREVLAGAAAWAAGDAATATNRLRAALELLTQARERFYPVDAFLLDLCLIDVATPTTEWRRELEVRRPVSFLASAAAVEQLGQRAPEILADLCQAVTDGWADVAGGSYQETDESLRPVGSVLWQYGMGARVYRNWIDDRTVETFARRRFGLYPMLPQVARRFGMHYGIPLALDGSHFPVPSETKRLWTSPDGSYLESLTRPPVPADRWTTGTALPWRIGQTMREDHVATVVLAHWPGRTSGWFEDYRRITKYAPVLMRWVTLSDFFHLTDRPYESLRPRLDDYQSPYLTQTVARSDPEPISRRVQRYRLRGRWEALSALAAMARLKGAEPLDYAMLIAAEDALERGDLNASVAQLETFEAILGQRLRSALLATEGGSARGYLVFNPLLTERRVAIRLAPGERTDSSCLSVRAEQAGKDGTEIVLDLPALGYAWVGVEMMDSLQPGPRVATPAFPTSGIGVRENRLWNNRVEVEIDPATGGLRAVRAVGDPAPRLGQQLVMTGLYSLAGQPASSRMRVESISCEASGPVRAQVRVKGTLIDPSNQQMLAGFEQVVRIWADRPVVELEITLTDLDVAWLSHAGYGDPWEHFLSCRWAWPDPNATFRRTSWLCPEPSTASRPETAEAIEIAARRGRTTILPGGLAHHQRYGKRMLDTLLIAGRETARAFQVQIVLDQEHPHRATLEGMIPPLVLPCDSGKPRGGDVASVIRADHPAVAVIHVGWIEPDADNPDSLLILHLIETAGAAARCQVRLARPPASARQTDFQGETMLDLVVQDHAVLVDLTAHELARVEIRFEPSAESLPTPAQAE